MNFIILGAGAIGCYVGARLAHSGQRVTLIGRPRVLDPLAKGGITVTDLDGFKAHVNPSQLHFAANLTEADLTAPFTVLLCVKGGATESAARELAAICAPGTPVVSLQNGVDNVGRIQAQAPALQALAGMVPFNVVMPSPNLAHRATVGSLMLQNNPATQAILPLLGAAGLPTVLKDDMRAVQWGKLLINLGNPVNALADVPVRQMLNDRSYRKVLASLQFEALAGLRAAHIEPAQVANAPPKLLPHLLGLPNWIFKRVASRMLRMDAQARSSMWADVQQGRVTEIDDLCGAVVRLGATHGVPTPLNQAMCLLMHQHKKGTGYAGTQMANALMQRAQPNAPALASKQP